MKAYIKCAMNVNINESSTINEILDCIEKHFEKQENVTIDPVVFETRKQEEN